MITVTEIKGNYYRINGGINSLQVFKRRQPRYDRSYTLEHWNKAYEIKFFSQADLDNVYKDLKQRYLDEGVLANINKVVFNKQDTLILVGTDYLPRTYCEHNNTITVVKESETEIIMEPTERELKIWKRKEALEDNKTMIETFFKDNINEICKEFGMGFKVKYNGQIQLGFDTDKAFTDFVLNAIEKEVLSKIRKTLGFEMYINKRLRNIHSTDCVIAENDYKMKKVR